MKLEPKTLLVWAVIGLIAGMLAGLLLGGGGLIQYLIWGLIGSVVGGALLPKIGLAPKTGSEIVNQIITATVGAIIVVIIARIIA